MSNKIDEERLRSSAKELAKGVKTEQDVADLSRTLLKMTVETALGAEMEEHLGYAPVPTDNSSGLILLPFSGEGR